MTATIDPNLAARIQAYYPTYGVNANGIYVGSEKFKKKLIALSPDFGSEKIRQAVNYMTKHQLLPTTSRITPVEASPETPSFTAEPTGTIDPNLAARIHAYYPTHGVNAKGVYVGSKKFKKKLIALSPDFDSEKIRQAVNYMTMQQLLPTTSTITPVEASPETPSFAAEPTGQFEKWVQAQINTRDGRRRTPKQIVAELLPKIPPHLSGYTLQLDFAVQKSLEQQDSPHDIGPSVGYSASGPRKSHWEFAAPTAEVEAVPSLQAPNSFARVIKETRVANATAGYISSVDDCPVEKASPLEPAPRRNAKVIAALEDEEMLDSEEPLEEVPSLKQQMCLLSTVNVNENPEGSDLASNDVKNAVIFSSQVLEQHQRLLPQYGLLGEVLSSDGQSVTDPRLFLNTNHPFSAFLCGLQGAGKSHSLSCLLENCLLSTRTLGVLKRPLSAMVFHFSQYTSRLNFRPCEAAFIACPDPKFKVQCTAVPVTVLVSPSNLLGLRLAYSQIPGVTVKPFLLRPQDLNIGSMLTLMSVSKSSEQPLYISHVTKLLREMAAESSEFDFLGFKQRLAQVQMLPLQRKPLEQRLDLLESFLDLDGTSNVFDFTEGSITIVDLSCPFVDENTACVLFNIALSTFLQDSTPGAGKVVAVDEAHKYITDTPASKVFTESLLQLIRQQRHYGARIIISTQEPTIDPRLMDLCSVTLIHRFTSPEWFKTLQKHVSTMEERDVELFKRIINLRVGEGLIFAPGAVVAASVLENNQDTMLEDYPWGEGHPYQHAGADKVQPIEVEKLGSRFLKVKVRRRLTADGGKSLVCV